MIRSILILVLVLVLYQAVKAVFRVAISAYQGGDDRPPRLPGEDMVRDPQCKTYVVKGRALGRRIGGQMTYFCSTACADAYERDHRAR